MTRRQMMKLNPGDKLIVTDAKEKFNCKHHFKLNDVLTLDYVDEPDADTPETEKHKISVIFATRDSDGLHQWVHHTAVTQTYEVAIDNESETE